MRRSSALPIVLVLPVLLAAPAWASGAAAGPSASGYVETTIDDPVNVPPPVSRPTTAACTVTLADDVPSNGPTGAPQSFSGTLTPPTACGSRWSRIVLDVTVSAKGRQFDRVGGITVGGAQIWSGTTQEPDADGLTWHVDKDVTSYASLLGTRQPFTGGIGNYVDSTYVGVYRQTATLTYYAADAAHPAPDVPDRVVGVGAGDVDGSTRSITFDVGALPRNLESAQVEVYVKGNGCDEQWFTAVPSDVAARFPGAGLCGGGPYREVTVGLDGTTVGATQYFPYIYSGGIVPTLWRPTVAIGTFDLEPERVDITPLVGRLVDGAHHRVTLTVPQAQDVWNLSANLLLRTDAGSTQTRGALVRDTIVPVADVRTATSTAPDGSVTATTTARRSSTLAGWVQTSHGRVSTTVTQDVAYRSTQQVLDGGNRVVVDQDDRGSDVVAGKGGGRPSARTHSWDYPLTVDQSVDSYVDDNTYALSGRVTMGRTLSDTVTSPGRPAVRTGSTETMTSSGQQAREAGVLVVADGASSARWTGLVDGRPWVHEVDAAHGHVTLNTVNGVPQP